jgi:hypothetical protein
MEIGAMSYKPSKKTFGKYVYSTLKNMLTLLKSDELPYARIFVVHSLVFHFMFKPSTIMARTFLPQGRAFAVFCIKQFIRTHRVLKCHFFFLLRNLLAKDRTVTMPKL